MSTNGSKPLLEVEDLVASYPVGRGLVGAAKREPKLEVHAVDGVSFALNRGEMLALVGESGCGKTSTAQSVLRLIETSGGSIRFDGQEITGLSSKDLRPLRRRMQIVYQDPYESLDPRFRVGATIEEPLQVHGIGSKEERREEVKRALELAGLTPPELYIDRYPHELSGGQRQRVAIAASLVLHPELLVADEPVSMLDVSVRAGILSILDELRDNGPRRADDHARPLDGRPLRRPDRGHVPRPDRRGRPDARGDREPAAPLHARAPLRGAEARPARPRDPSDPPRGDAELDPHPGRLPLQPPLPDGDRGVQDRRSRSSGGRRRAGIQSTSPPASGSSSSTS